MRTTVSIGILGCGTVGGGVAELLLRERRLIESRSAVNFQVAAIAVHSLDKSRPPGIPSELFTTNAAALIDDPTIDVIVECIGGVNEARELVERALERGKHIVTANKDLIATEGPRLFALAASTRASIHYEAAVCSAVPIVRVLKDSLAGEDILEVSGVLNGTANFILSAMHAGQSYERALLDAQRLGFAEADPSGDIDGVDAAHKLAILCQLAFRTAITSRRIARTGISAVTPEAVAVAHRQGYAVKLLGLARKTVSGLSAEIGPAFVPLDHPFAQPKGPENCVRVVGRAAGSLFFSGLGAGREPSASAVVGDIIETLRSIGARHATAALAPAVAVEPAFYQFNHIQVSAVRYPVWRDITDLPHLTKETTHDDHARTHGAAAF
ncbi:MAG: homoserine dehydrogenase [Candidatus Eremiobacteraeota bacterium]|nr:homoserine dehydrogenase [Candidatus Eremiobacteraeota bacterium]